jgi:hypothetical protein
LTHFTKSAYDGGRLSLAKTSIIVKKKVFIPLIIVLLLLIAVPVGVYLAQHNQDIQQHASTDASLVATVDNTPVTEQDVKAATREQYNDKAITQQTLQDTLDNVVEDKLIALEAKKRGITVSDQEVTQRASQLGGSASGQMSIISQARSDLLKEKVSQAVTKTREVQSVGFWLPPDNYGAPLTDQERATIASQKAQKTTVLSEIKTKLDANEDPLTVAQEIQKKYPLFASIIAVNGYVVDKTPDTSVMTTPKLYTYSDDFKTNTYLSQIFAMSNGQVQIVLTDANAGGVVVKVTNSSDGQYASFDDWLAKNKASRTKIVKQP